MKSVQLRKAFYEFFEKKGHTLVPSSSLIPADDPTLLFANAGMNQFKDVFLGHEVRSYKRAVSIQKCIRAGGKHNDLDNVGFTTRHLTFFEMMGNFSFGDYFKKEAIAYAWEFLTQTIGLDDKRIYVSVFEQDDEAYTIWHQEIGLPAARIVRLGARDNFWQMGETGPCGPCTELYYDRGVTEGCQQASCAPGCDCSRFLEIWNLVFMQFNRQKDGTDKPLAKTGVDTGMGLDRLAALMQNAPSVYETDLFAPIIAQIEQMTGHVYATANNAIKSAFRVIADHIRSTTCAIADGCTPAADGRGYVLRKIIRRAALFAQKLSSEQFFPQLVDGVIAAIGDIYPELSERRNTIIAILEQELSQFSRNLARGTVLLERYFAEHGTTLPVSGTMAFTLYDTYGFPLELMRVLVLEQGTTLDLDGFEQEMSRQRAQSTHQAKEGVQFAVDAAMTTVFTGYDEYETATTIQALTTDDGVSVVTIQPGSSCWIITQRSPLYVACGGQINDEGCVVIGDCTLPFDNIKKQGGIIACHVTTPITLHCGDNIIVKVDRVKRLSTMNNHTATHLLQSALIQVLGAGVKQAGSLVAPDYLRFDFSCAAQPTQHDITRVENIVNEKIRENIPLSIHWTTLTQAQQDGVIAFFGEKYNPESVRVVSIPGFSRELCGGTHVRATGDIGMCKIIEVTAPAAGIRRIVAVTGQQALSLFQSLSQITKQISTSFKVPDQEIVAAVEKQRTLLKEAQQQIALCRKQLLHYQIPQWAKSAELAAGTYYGIVVVENVPAEELRIIAEQMVKERSGLWTIISTDATSERIAYVIRSAADITQATVLPTLLNVLKQYGLQGSCKNMVIQGGAPMLPQNLSQIIHEWLVKNQ